MKFGLYTAMGKQTCGKFAASCGHEALDAKTYAAWGVVSHSRALLSDTHCLSPLPNNSVVSAEHMNQGRYLVGLTTVCLQRYALGLR